jgi:hypothetical protein
LPAWHLFGRAKTAASAEFRGVDVIARQKPKHCDDLRQKIVPSLRRGTPVATRVSQAGAGKPTPGPPFLGTFTYRRARVINWLTPPTLRTQEH